MMPTQQLLRNPHRKGDFSTQTDQRSLYETKKEEIPWIL